MSAPLFFSPWRCAKIVWIMKSTKIGYLALPLILILSLILSSGCDLLPEIDTSPLSQITGNTTQVASESPASPAPRTTTPLGSGSSISITGSQSPILPSIADVVAKVKPSVVKINIQMKGRNIFNQPFTSEGVGSGWIISEDGFIVTNSHVVIDADSITVELDDGRTLQVNTDTVATDPLSDIAVLQVNAENLPTAIIRDSGKLKVGDWVVAIGNAMGKGISATSGIVSRKDVEIKVDAGQTLTDLIQTDAAINPGNSGGPLVNLSGEVIGITSAKLSNIVGEGMGYAISSRKATPIIQGLIDNGYIVRPWLGVEAQTVDESLVFFYDLAVTDGALIRGIASNSPASRADIQELDVIVKFGDTMTPTVDALVQAIHSFQAGQEVEITFWRGDTRMTTQATLEESPPPS